MSYTTRVMFEFSDEVPSDAVTAAARAYLDRQNLYAVDDVLQDLLRGWDSGSTEFNGLVVKDIEGLMSEISSAFPAVRFYVRGMGEEYADVWLRQFEGGNIVHAIGPFEDQTD